MKTHVCLWFVLLAACSSPTTSSPDAATSSSTTVELLAFFDLPRQPETEALSGAYFDLPTRTLYALQDIETRIVPLTATVDYRSWTVGTPIALTGRPPAAWDGEGLARVGDGSWLVVTNETLPLIEQFSAAGVYLNAVAVPPRFAMQHAGNMGIESLSVSPSGAKMFFANEGSLTTDGPIATKSSGTLVRIQRDDLAAGKDDEYAYLTDTVGAGDGGTLGVSDVTAVNDNTVLVLERGYQAGYGNTVRIYRVDLTSGADVSSVAALTMTTPRVTKKLVVDLAMLPPMGAPNPQMQPNPILDNYEGLALGEKLADGRQLVFVISDDNQSDMQVARILVLALPL